MILLPKLNAKSNKIVLLVLFMISFFGIVIFNIAGFHYVASAIILWIAYRYRNEKIVYKPFLYLYFIGFVLSCIYSQLFNGQPFWLTMSFCSGYVGLLFSLFIIHKKFTSKELIDIIIFIAVVYVILYIVQWIVYPFCIVSSAANWNVESETYRLRIPGSICTFILFYYGINKVLQGDKTRGLIYSCMGFIPIIVMGFRTLTAITVISAFIMIATVTKKVKKTLMYFIFFCGVAYVASTVPIISDKIQEMQERQEYESDAGKENNIRLIAFYYLSEQYFVKPGEKIFGAGVPTLATEYTKNLNSLVEDYAIYWNDIGLVGLSFLIGIPTVLILCLIYLLCAWRCKSSDIQFVRFTALTMVFGSAMTTMELYRAGNILLFSILLCIEYQRSKELKMLSV